MRLRDLETKIIKMWESGDFPNKTELARQITREHGVFGVSEDSDRRGISTIISEHYGFPSKPRLEVKRNVLVIADLHAPFILDGYFEHCLEVYNEHQCTDVVLIGDILDNHYSSYHETDPDGFGGAEELRRAKKQIARFYKAFPNAKVCLGNHDILPDRKAFSSGVSKSWVKTIGEVLETPTWEYADSFVIDGVLYTHGTARKARPRCQDEDMSVVQGHYHSESYIYTFVTHEKTMFAMQLGAGVDRTAYALAYAKNFKKSYINCGVVKDNGRYAIIEPMLNAY